MDTFFSLLLLTLSGSESPQPKMAYWTPSRYQALNRRPLQLPSRSGAPVPEEPEVQVTAEVPGRLLQRGVEDRTPMIKFEAPVAAELPETSQSQVTVVIIAGTMIFSH